MTAELKKQVRAVDLAVFAGQKRQSPRTGFVHLFPNEEASDTIPLYENFCFTLALFRQKTTESVTLGKELLERLLAFQTQEGQFPIYLHEFPKCYDYQMGLRIAPILIYLLRLFPLILGSLKVLLEESLCKILAKRNEKPQWENRYRACLGLPLLSVDTASFSAADWTEWIITAQLAGISQFEIPYDAELQLLRVASPLKVQERGEPRPCPVEWILAEGGYSPRHLRDHPHQLHVAPLFPFSYSPTVVEENGLHLYWKGEKIHSLVGQGFIFDLPAQVEISRNDLFEVALFCDLSSETTLLVNGRKATFFRLGDQIEIRTPGRTISLRFELMSGSGDFCGHIFRANRPSQICKGYEAYDWQIGLRTLRRSETARIGVVLSSEATDYRQQDPSHASHYPHRVAFP